LPIGLLRPPRAPRQVGGRASTLGHARAHFSWRSDGFTAPTVDARARPRPS
jgi:hypothetical protein